VENGDSRRVVGRERRGARAGVVRVGDRQEDVTEEVRHDTTAIARLTSAVILLSAEGEVESVSSPSGGMKTDLPVWIQGRDMAEGPSCT
jgi:hypothetical protein